MNELLEQPVRLIARRRPLSSDRLETAFPPGMTLAAMLNECGLDPDVVPARVCIDDRVIEDALWEHVTPTGGQLVTVRVIPQGGGGQGKDVLRIVAMVGILALAIFAPYIAGFAGAAFLSSGIGAALLTGAISIGGSLLVSALIPPQQQNIPQLGGQSVDRSPSLSITGGRNDMRLYQPVPRIYGKMRITPPLAAEPYTEIVGNEQYLRMVFCVGYGPLLMPEADFRIGETPLTQFDGVEYEIRQGYLDDPPLTLFSNDVHEDALSLTLNHSDGFQQRTSQVDADELSIDIAFPNGNYKVRDTDGELVANDVTVKLEYRKVGETTWIEAKTFNIFEFYSRVETRHYPFLIHTRNGWTDVVYETIYEQNAGVAKTIRMGHRWMPITGAGQYEVRVYRVTPDRNDDPKIVDKCVWTSFRTIKSHHPVALKGMALVALRIKATDQLNGVVDQFNLIAQSILLAWNGISWLTLATSNPAAIYRDILQGTANARPLPDSRLDLPKLQEWADDCDAAGRTCNLIVDYQSTVFEVLRIVAATGRASFDLRDGKYSVVLDKPQTDIVQMFTPRNSWGFKGRKVFADLPHAIKIGFINQDNDWLQDERYVYADGYNADGRDGLTAASKFDTLDLLGVTNPDQIYKDGRYNYAQAVLRPESYELMTDVENLICTRGDLIGVAHDVPLWGLGQGRVVAIDTDSLGNTLAVTMDDPLLMDASLRYSVRIRLNDGTTAAHEIQSVAGEQWTLMFVEPIPRLTSPIIGNLLAYGELNRETVRLIVKGIEPKEGLEAQLLLVDEAPGVHTADQGPLPPHDPQITIPLQQRKPNPPIIDAIMSDESVLIRDMDGSFRTRIIIRLHYVSGGMPAKRVEVRYRRSDSLDSWAQTAVPVNGDSDELEIPQVVERTFYNLLIRSVSQYEVQSDPITITDYYTIGRTTPPPDVTTVILQERRLRWSYPNPPRDFAGFAVKMHFGSRPFWDDAIPIHDGLISQSFMDLDRASGVRTYLVKAVDSADYESTTPGILVVDWGSRLIGNAVEEIDYQSMGFPGLIEGGASVLGHLEANADLPFWTNNLDPMWTSASAPFWGASFTELVYTFSYTPPLSLLIGSMFIDAEVEGIYTIEYRTDSQVPFWVNDGDPFWTDDAAAMWATKGDWVPWPGQLTGLIHQQYDFRIIVNAGFTQGKILEVFLNVDMPDVTEKLRGIVIGSSGTRLPITETYQEITGVAPVLLDDGGTARYAVVVDKDVLGPLVKAYDGVGALTTALMDFDLEGY